MGLTRDEILRKAVIGKKSFPILSLGGEVTLRQLSSGEVLDIAKRFQDGEISLSTFNNFLIMSSVIDDDGTLIFNEDTIQTLSIGVGMELLGVITKYNNLETMLSNEKAKADLKKVQAKSR